MRCVVHALCPRRNGDGHIDVLIGLGGGCDNGNYAEGGQQWYTRNEVLLNDGESGFYQPSNGSGGWTISAHKARTCTTAVADFNLDGNVDIFVGNRYIQDALYLGGAKGGVTLHNSSNATAQGSGSAADSHTTASTVGNFNGDKYPDLFVCKYGAANVVFLGGKHGFTRAPDSDAMTRKDLSVSAAVADLDGNGFADLYVGNRKDGGRKGLSKANELLLNKGDGKGTFRRVSGSPGDDSKKTMFTRAVVLADFNSDGCTDILLGVFQLSNELWLSNGCSKGATHSGERYTKLDSAGTKPTGWTTTLGVGDLDGDGDLDVYEGQSGRYNLLWANNGSGGFEKWMPDKTDPITHYDNKNEPTWQVAMADMNADGLLDIVDASGSLFFQANCLPGQGKTIANQASWCYPCRSNAHGKAGRCYECPGGRVANDTGQVSCALPCLKGTHRPYGLNASKCVACPAGKRVAKAGVGNDACVSCTAGSYTPQGGQEQCTQCGANLYTHGGGRSACAVCDLCARGSVVGRACTRTSNTRCTRCVNRTWANITKSGQECSKCSACRADKNEFEAASCTSVFDSVCAKCAPSAPLIDPVNGQCKPCTICNASSLTKAICVNSSDTVCARCANGRYANKTKNATERERCAACPTGYLDADKDPGTPCTPCKVCAASEVQRSACDDKTADAQCVACRTNATWANKRRQTCDNCTVCKRGARQVTLSACAPASDAMCLTCPASTYAHERAGKQLCEPCTVCDPLKGRRVVSQCSNTSNGKCADTICPALPSRARQGQLHLALKARASNYSNGSTQRYRAEVDANCDGGFVGGGKLECMSDGRWTELPKCVRGGSASCNELQVSNSEPPPSSARGRQSPGARTLVQCKRGFVGSNTTTCLNTSAWDAKIACSPCTVGRFHNHSDFAKWRSAKPRPTPDRPALDMCGACVAGRISAATASTRCEPCERGHEANNKRTACIPCAEGKASESTAGVCAACPGRSVASEDKTKCEECAHDEFYEVGTKGRVACRKCTRPRERVSEQQDRCVCERDTYLPAQIKAVCVDSLFDGGRLSTSRALAVCEECPECIICEPTSASDVQMRAREGYAVAHANVTVGGGAHFVNIFLCANKDACPGNVTLGQLAQDEDAGCATGYSGVLCSSCAEGFWMKDGSTCQECSDTGGGSLPLVFSAVALLGFVAVLGVSFLMSNRSVDDVKRIEGLEERFQDLQADAKTLLGLAQVLSLCGVTLQISYPSPFSEVADLFSFLSLDVLAVLNVQCAMPYTFHGRFVARCCLPLVLLCLVRVLSWMFACRTPPASGTLRAAFDAADEDDSGALDREEMCLAISLLKVQVTPEELGADVGLDADCDLDFDVFGKWWQRHQASTWSATMSYFVLFLIYPSTCVLVFEAFSCRDISSTTSVLRADTRIDCNGATYTLIFYEAVFMSTVFVVGVPMFWLWSLRKYRDDIQAVGPDGEASVAAQQFSFLIGAYKPEFYLWEVAEMWRKVALTGLVSVVATGSMVQIMVAASASLGFQAMHARCYPFKTRKANFLKLVADWRTLSS